ncbi:hypothetical protein [Deinococcus sonorensis]|uniref:DUF1918 domain-containing protein n=1 Tax=Deinococcus sonorensis TaxID=309891 RepID=A0ABV8YAK1_9DEIO
MPLEVRPTDLQPGERLELRSTSTAAQALGPTVLATFDNGRVTVSWDGQPFLPDQGAVTVTVAADAASTSSNPEDSYDPRRRSSFSG